MVTTRPAEPDGSRATPPPQAPEAVPLKPLWRGKLHQFAFFFAVPAGVLLIGEATSITARVAAIIYAIALAGMYGTSALYHRLPWSPSGRTWMKRLDHSMIFVLIAGTYTPLSLLVLHGGWRWVVFGMVWGVAALGIGLKMFRIDGLKALGATLYIGLGWVVVIASPQLFGRLSWEATTLVITGGVLYTAGAIVLAAHRPDPSPRVFGYHEVWHSMVIGGSLCHYVAIFLVLLAR
jgi:hemolysin III